MLRVDDLHFEPGTLTVVFGPNGAGKTVWLEKLAGLRDPEGMSVHYGAEPLWRKKRWTRRRRLNPAALRSYAYAGQSPEQALFMRTVKEELIFSLNPFGQEDAGVLERALQAAGLDRSWLERDPYRMSGGERRRTALAMLFVTPAPWLFLDEPTAGLDRDGHERLAAQLGGLKREGRGIILVSHDTDWALPLADRVLLLHPGGEMKSCSAEELMAHPEWMAGAGMQVPGWMRIVRAAWRGAGGPLDRMWNPAGAAEALERVEAPEVYEELLVPDRGHGTKKHMREEAADAHPLMRFDPRAVWLSYVLISAGLFSLSDWPGLLGGAAAVTALLIIGRIPLKRWKGLIAGFVYFSLILASFASIADAWAKNGSFSWNSEAFLGTLFPMARTLIVLLIGLTLPVVMTPLSLRRALEPFTPRSGKPKAFWQRLVLTVTLTIRFVPVLLAEWERFGRIFLARGKETSKSPRSFFRRLKGITLPLLLALFRLGDEVAVALESRGVRRDINPTKASRLRWKWRDTAMAAGAAALTGMLWLLG